MDDITNRFLQERIRQVIMDWSHQWQGRFYGTQPFIQARDDLIKRINKEKIIPAYSKIKDIPLKFELYSAWKNAVGREKSYRNIAKKFQLFLSSGKPNGTAVQRAIRFVEKQQSSI
jgi:hypothetical protein